ncbi:MAG: hypothetical protein A4E47_00796 [Methanosaeta sp. PtaU1.Bin028]|nr:MAG: hypothetical protein A4E47_00796 [Methanosaeta sp. PtaU1.Bin028]
MFSTSLFSALPTMSSDAVMDQRVGTSFLLFPKSPTDRRRDIWSTSTRDKNSSSAACDAEMSVSATRASTRRGTLGLDVSSTSLISPLGPDGDKTPSKLRFPAGGLTNETSSETGRLDIAISWAVSSSRDGRMA